MKRLAVLCLRDQSYKEMGFLALATTGTVVDRVGPVGFHLPHGGALCGHLPHFTGEQVSRLQTKDGKTVFMVAQRDEAVTSALCLGAEQFAQTSLIAQATRPLGSSCRLCEISGCALRLAPPATRPAVLNEHVRGQSDYEAL
jgi:predicted transcriptional regulator